MKEQIKYNNNELTVNEHKLIFDYDVAQYRYDGEQVYVRLEIPTGIKLTSSAVRNVFAISKTGQIIWRLPIPVLKEFPKFSPLPITSIFLRDGVLLATDFMGRIFKLNKNTGEGKIVGATK
ncbi:PQQ-binding-like beta-propeller repeat protein [Loigolactobacillus iwatensis]|uniref:PQQ-binding-like beta-propeller repeat protein n=1 Tax=Loigolactobacillus iwatensis TaxID=1267156 RepID=UPI000F7F4464|nr:PQQ-binding-like beta-propeller repeat protein [Loigolactobacillus iwatensis]